MGWAARYIEQLKQGETVQFRPRGNSMTGKIESGDLVTVEPVIISELQEGDIVLSKVRGTEYLHLIKAVRGEQFLIGNNRRRINGWVSPAQVFGKCVRVE